MGQLVLEHGGVGVPRERPEVCVGSCQEHTGGQLDLTGSRQEHRWITGRSRQQRDRSDVAAVRNLVRSHADLATARQIRYNSRQESSQVGGRNGNQESTQLTRIQVHAVDQAATKNRPSGTSSDDRRARALTLAQLLMRPWLFCEYPVGTCAQVCA